MAGMSMTFFPRNTTLVGAIAPGKSYSSEPFDVTQYIALTVTAMLEAAANASVTAVLETSSDLVAWNPFGSLTTLTVGTPAPIGGAGSDRYVRVTILVTTSAGVGVATLWVKGVARED